MLCRSLAVDLEVCVCVGPGSTGLGRAKTIFLTSPIQTDRHRYSAPTPRPGRVVLGRERQVQRLVPRHVTLATPTCTLVRQSRLVPRRHTRLLRVRLLRVRRNRFGSVWAASLQGAPKKRGRRLMTILLSNLNRFKVFSLEDSVVNLQLNGYQKSHCTLHNIATLPCETLMSAKQAINNKLQGSVAT